MTSTDHPDLQRQLGQYFTPRWAAEAIIDEHFADLKAGDLVIEPTCGDGAFLHAIPQEVDAIGVEIDPHWARMAAANTGRRVIVGDFMTADLPERASAIVGNPPFASVFIESLLDRSHELLGEGGRCGLILPAYALQTSSTVMRMHKRWSIRQDLLPRNLFPGLSMPIVLAMFTKEAHRRLFGFFLYRETCDVQATSTGTRETLERSQVRGSIWRQAVNKAFDELTKSAAGAGQRVHLSGLYSAMRKRPPTENQHLEAKVRQVLQRYPEFRPCANGVWERQELLMAA